MKRFLNFLVIFVLFFSWAISVHADEDTVSEIKVILNQGLIAKNDMLEYGDVQGLEDMVEGWNRNLYFVAGFTEDLEKGAALELEALDYSSINVWHPGVYTVTVRLKICEDYAGDFTISDEVRTLCFQITVGTPDEITFAFNHIAATFIQYDFTAPVDASPVLWYAKAEQGKQPEDTDWKEGEEEFYRRSPSMVRILCSALDKRCDYFFQMRSGNLASNILKLESTALFPSDDKDMGGDRDGNDNNDDTEKPPLIQPSPLPPSNTETSEVLPPVTTPQVTEPSDAVLSQVTPPVALSSKSVLHQRSADNGIASIESGNEPLGQGFESVDGDTMTISGARIMWLLSSNAEKIPFGWNRVSIEIPAAFLEGLGLSGKDMLALTLSHETDLSFDIMITAKGEEIKSLTEIVVRLPVPETRSGYTLMLDGKSLDTAVVCEQGYAVFTIDQAGSYELCEKGGALKASCTDRSAPLKQQTKELPQPAFTDFLPVIIGVILLIACSGWFLWRKYR